MLPSGLRLPGSLPSSSLRLKRVPRCVRWCLEVSPLAAIYSKALGAPLRPARPPASIRPRTAGRKRAGPCISGATRTGRGSAFGALGPLPGRALLDGRPPLEHEADGERGDGGRQPRDHAVTEPGQQLVGFAVERHGREEDLRRPRERRDRDRGAPDGGEVLGEGEDLAAPARLAGQQRAPGQVQRREDEREHQDPERPAAGRAHRAAAAVQEDQRGRARHEQQRQQGGRRPDECGGTAHGREVIGRGAPKIWAARSGRPPIKQPHEGEPGAFPDPPRVGRRRSARRVHHPDPLSVPGTPATGARSR